MDEILRSQYGDDNWPDAADDMYERVEVLGRGSFGVVWMARRVSKKQNEYDDEYVALKNIEIKEEKGRVYAQREISILQELRHPNVIRLIRSFPVYNNQCQLVAMQMARGPNLQYLISKRGALGLPLCRLISRQLIAAVSYLHGRAVLHRDIKPTNCILENTQIAPQDLYDWLGDDEIWSDDAAAEKTCTEGKFKLMLIDFGFARALDNDEVVNQPRLIRGSIVSEQRLSTDQMKELEHVDTDEVKINEAVASLRRASVAVFVPSEIEALDEASEDEEDLNASVEAFAANLDVLSKVEEVDESGNAVAKPETTAAAGAAITTEKKPRTRRVSHVSMQVPFEEAKPAAPNGNGTNNDGGMVSKQKSNRRHRNRQSTTRAKVRSMSALGTKAYAAPEIKHELRNKTRDDVAMSKEALTECVADYGMIVDAYSVGWTLRVVMTGIPPNVTISQYMKKLEAQKQEVIEPTGCLCCKITPPPPREVKVRDTADIPKEATVLITLMTKTNPEERITVREAQNHVYIRGKLGGEQYTLPEGDVPSKHGDPVVPLKCAQFLADDHKEFKSKS